MFAKKVTLSKELKKMRTSHADIWVENLSGQLAQRVRRPWDRSKPRVFEEQQGDRCSRSGMKGGRSEGMTGDRGGFTRASKIDVGPSLTAISWEIIKLSTNCCK